MDRIEQLQTRQTQDDAVLNVINRYWNQLNEDIQILLQRFATETSEDADNKSMKISTVFYVYLNKLKN